MAQVGIARCKPEMKDYCFHGQCMYIVDLDEHYCRYGQRGRLGDELYMAFDLAAVDT